jgi:predicted nucleic acid-binding Zn ribbon protein
VWTKIKKIIPQKAKRFGLDNELKIINLKNDWDRLVAEALGDKFKKRSETVNLKDGILYIRCQNSVWAGEFQIRKEKLLGAIKNQKINIKQIRFIF